MLQFSFIPLDEENLSELEPFAESVQKSEQPLVSAVAEAFPESDEYPKPINDDFPIQNEVIPSSNSIPLSNSNDPSESDNKLIPAQVQPIADEVKPAADTPVVLPKKKKKFGPKPDSDSSIESDEEDNDDDDDEIFFDKKKPGSNRQWPLNTFFPMNFGSTSGGAIAIANSFSTGKGGTASSHATAYGSSAKQRAKPRKE